MNPRWQQQRRASCAQAAALGLAAAVMLVPANVLPILSTSISGSARTDTIFSGTVRLCEDGLWVLGAIVFTASILIPVFKLAGLGWLLFAVHRGTGASAPRLAKLHGVLDFVGRWSMLDVFLAAFLAGVVQFGSFATIAPQPGIVAFAAAVVLTMVATHSFDPRLLWDEPPADPAPAAIA